MKRFISLILTLALLLSLMPTGLLKLTVNAVTADETQEFAGGTGTAEDPFLIATADHLNNVRNYLNAHFKMINDIVFEEGLAEKDNFMNLTSGFVPIGSSSSSAFTGTFDGNGYCIKNLYIRITSSSTIYAGLFGYNRGTIKNLGLYSGDVLAYSDYYAYAGGIAGYNGGTVSYCYNSGTILSSSVSSYDIYAGGITGTNPGTIDHCYNAGTVSSVIDGDRVGASAGGITGTNSGTITACYDIGNVSVSATPYTTWGDTYTAAAGGIAGKNYGTITKCYNVGAVLASSYSQYVYARSGGIAGVNGDKGTIKNCYNTGEIRAYSTYVAHAGGIVGLNSEWSYSADVIDCYNIGSVSSESTFYDSLTGLPYAYAGGIAGECDRYATATNCYYLDNVPKGAGEGSDYATKCTSYQLKQKSTFKNFDFDTVWVVGGHNHNSEYKYPQFQLVENVDYTLGYAFNNDAHWTKCNICEMRIGTSSDHIYDSCEDSQCNICGYERVLDVHRKAVDDATAVQIDNTSASPFVVKNGVYNSTNKSIPSTSTFSIKATKDCILVIDYHTSTRKDIDYLIIKHNNTTMLSASGATSWSTITLVLDAGDVVDIKYSKPSSYTSGVDKGDDAVYFKLQCVRMLPAEDFLPTCEGSVVCDICGVEVKPATGHSYDNACDAECNACGKIRSVPAHVYDNTCDTECNICGHTRTITHNYEWIIDAENTCGDDGVKHEECTVCHTTQNVGTVISATGKHTYDNACDMICNVCAYVRAVSDHIFDNDCDSACNECGFARDRDHLYDMECDVTCNKCGATRVVPHFYDDESDSFCNLCGHNRAKASGKTGDCDWYVIDTTLYITGSGAMGDYNTYSTLPWGKTITEVVIKDGVTTIGSYAFYYCSKLTSVTISDSVISIGNNAFSSCSNLTTVTIGDSVTQIGDYAFSDCSTLRTITIPGSVESIGDYTFRSCTKLADITIEDGVTAIGDYAFYFCYALDSVTIPGSVISVGNYAFDNCSSITSVVMNSGTKQIGKMAFYDCYNLSSITIPNTITTIGSDAFYNCSALSSVYITDLKAWCEIDFVDYDDNPLCRADNLYLNGELATELNIPDGTTTIKKYAFACFDGFTSVTIPSSVTSIGNYAFYKCTSLTSVAMETNIETIGSYAFAGCSRLTSVMIPGSVTTINDHAFYECTSLSSLTIQTGVETIGNYAFSYCKGIISVVIPGSVTSVGDYAFSYCNNLKVAIIGDGITQIAPDLFWGSSNLTDVAIGKSVKQVGNSAFYSCSKLKDVWYSGATQSDISISYSNTPLTNANWHCNVDIVEEHIYDSVCDVFCNICDNMRTVLHVYDNACDTSCNVCGTTRQVPDHTYSGVCDADCNECGLSRTVPDHVYENACDTDCNECGQVRTVADHMYDNVCDTTCNKCSYIRQVPSHFVVETVEEHVLTNSTTYPFTLSDGWYSSTNKSDSTSSTFTLTTKHDCELAVFYKVSSEQNYDKLIIKQNSTTLATASGTVSEMSLTVTLVAGDVLTFTYSKDGSRSSGSDVAQFKLGTCDCDTYVEAESVASSCVHPIVCAGCGLEIKPISTVHTYDNVCDTTCNECGFGRTAPHEYDHACDTTCNECGYVRTVPDHVYDDEKDHVCNECGYVAYISGDLTGDDKINSLDGLLLMRYLNGWDVNIGSPEAMDVNGDGKVNSLDGLILMRYLNGWDVTLG